MIKVQVKKHHHQIVYLSVVGHALYDEHGKDIVCAGVSAVTLGSFNSLIEHGFEKQLQFDMDEGKATVEVLENEHDIQVILETLIISLRSIEETYQEYIRVNITEV